MESQEQVTTSAQQQIGREPSAGPGFYLAADLMIWCGPGEPTTEAAQVCGDEGPEESLAQPTINQYNEAPTQNGFN